MVPASYGLAIMIFFPYLARSDEGLLFRASPKPKAGLGYSVGFTRYTIFSV